jgi:hypothetical protein
VRQVLRGDTLPQKSGAGKDKKKVSAREHYNKMGEYW